MIEHQEQFFAPEEAVATPQAAVTGQEVSPAAEAHVTGPAAAPAASADAAVNGTAEEPRGWHAEAGRKGARRVHQLIEEGRLYEKEHGLKRGRQRLRQLIEMGKLYEQERGLRPRRHGRTGELPARASRDEVVATLLECLVRIARPSYRARLARLVEALRSEEEGHAA
jgi:hypothetical protein